MFKSFASVLLRLGIDAPHAERAIREAFVLAAIESARRSARRATQSHVASIAGISRLDVRKILAARSMPDDRSEHRATRIERIIQGWKTDPSFLNRRHTPKALGFAGSHSEFSELVRRYGRDVTPRALREQLLRLGIIETKGKAVTLAKKGHDAPIRSTAALNDLRFLISTLEDFDWGAGRRTFSNVKVSIPVATNKAAQLVRGIALERLETALQAVSALQLGSDLASKRARQSRCRVFVSASIAADVAEVLQ